MSAYMRGQFPFMGIPGPTRAALQRAAREGLGKPSEQDIIELAEALWAMPEREYQYAACDLLARHATIVRAHALPRVKELILTKSWWDTVDHLASHVVGTMVAGHPNLAIEMDGWIEDGNMWVIRTAILHQLKFKSRTDSARLFRYCERAAGHREFFIRKAIGWALREYSKTDSAAVRQFVAGHDATLSGLSKREAVLWLNGGPKAKV